MTNLLQTEHPCPYRRKIFYLPGYDPFPPRRYRELYRREAAVQAAISGYQISQSPAQDADRFGWHIEATIENRTVIADMRVLVWADLVRHSMSGSILSIYRQLAYTAWIYLGSGAFWRMARLRKGPLIAGLYPAIFLLGQLALAVALVWGSTAFLPSISQGYIPRLVALGLGLVAAYGLLRWFRAKDGKVFAWYLVQDFAHASKGAGAYPEDLRARMAGFRREIEEALAESYDEVLVIGHSSGAHIAVSVLADLLRARDWELPEGAAKLSFLTLGHAVPMMSFLPKAQVLRRDLHDLSHAKALFWLDVTAPGDGCCFALCDPVAVTGVADADQVWPLMISAAFSERLKPETWRKLKWRWFRLHFQYLCAFDNLAGDTSEYDYFKTTAGPLSLSERYGARRPSASRITRVASGYRDMA